MDLIDFSCALVFFWIAVKIHVAIRSALKTDYIFLLSVIVLILTVLFAKHYLT